MAAGSEPVRGWRPWAVFAGGVLAFVAAMFSRTSFGVAGLAAAERFGSPVALMSTFVVVQMIVYAAMQIPAGLLVDRFGPRATLTAGGSIMALGQLGLALATTFPAGLAARVFIGGGDAMIWSAVIRLIVAWFQPGQAAILTQVASVAGQAGQWASAVPLVRILNGAGWTPAFLTVAAALAVSAVVNLLVVRDAPPGVAPVRTPLGTGGVLAALREVWAMPAAQLGFFLHMSTAFPALVFTLMWGFPFLTAGQGLSDEQAGQLMTVFVFASVLFGPLVGVLSRRLENRRVGLALSVTAYTAAVWAAILLWPGTAPVWLLVALVFAIALDFPASNIVFDINRSHIPGRRIGTASGLVIIGGFSAALLDVLLIGLVLDWVGGDDPGPAAFKAAMATQLPILAFAVVMVLRANRKLNASLDQ